MYATIFIDLLEIVLQPNTNAMKAWDRLRNVFNDNQHSRTLSRHHQFTNIWVDNFSNISTYFKKIKNIVDQMEIIGNKVEDKRMVLQLVAGLNEAYDTIDTHINQTNPFPTFYEARSMLILEESQKNRQASAGAMPTNIALFTYTDNRKSREPNSSYNSTETLRHNNSYNTRGRGSRSNGRGGSRSGNRNINRNGNNTNGSSYGPNNYSGPYTYSGLNRYNRPQTCSGPRQNVWTIPYPWTWPNMPPCPYPITNWFRPNTPSNYAGVLGPRPQFAHSYAAFVAPSQGYVPTDIEQALHTMSLNPPDDNWYMYTLATSHMAASQGIIQYVFSLRIPKFVTVGNDHKILSMD
ncbi:uncharacterized protein [Rutidosis leptorrhynchoides]|uniref:uncharacterized protein n=1 Tax=Rutidosis leptorrhynchoides TaxID=125765 RepID=UPI003A98D919